MKIKLEITASPELLEVLKSIFGGFTARKELAPASDAPTSSRRQIKEPSKKTVAKEETATEADTAPEETNDNSTTEAVTVETVRAAVQVKAQSGKRDLVKNLLTKFEVARVTDLPEDSYPKFLQEVNAL